ncbi:Uncharacterized protein TCM_004454 [Theobroma cacao]|uniref:HMA domain-containing protein n=1 Tax=Theobroma cacao TaxID=3641 RepID=A0A061DRW8_THECC|nr:Uncharacterized protein TCM_004454 [Theobroma cacao]
MFSFSWFYLLFADLCSQSEYPMLCSMSHESEEKVAENRWHVCSMKEYYSVYAIDIDAKNGLVSVWGMVQPSMLIQTISEKVGKKAELYAYEKNPKVPSKMLAQGNSCSPCKYEKNNQPCSFPDGSNDHDKGKDNHDQAVHNEVKGNIPKGPEGTLSWHHPQNGMKKKKHGFAGWFGKKSTVEPRVIGNYGGPRPGYARLPPPPPPIPPPSYRYGQHAPLYPYSPPYRITRPPRPYPYDFYEKKEAPIGNSAFHSFRDDNVNACSMM